MSLRLITLLSIFITSFQIQGACIPLLNRLMKKDGPFAHTDEYQYRQKIGSIEKMTNFFRRKKENPDPALNIKVWKKIAIMNEHILNGTHAPNERRWRTFFREFEANFISYKRSKELVDIIFNHPDESPSAFLARLEGMGYPEVYRNFIARRIEEVETLENLRMALDIEKKNTLVHLGNNYQEYRMVRGNLEDLLEKPECNEQCKHMISMLFENLGADSSKEKLMFELFFQGMDRPDTRVMRELLYQEELFVLTKLKKERNAELLRFLVSFVSQPEILDKLFGLIYKSNLLGRQRTVKLFQMIYNAQARKHHFPKINRVIHGPKEPEKSMDLLQNLNTSVGNDELLISFSRRVDALAEGAWKGIKEHAKEADPSFVKRMDAAEEKAKARGELSPTQEPSFVARLAALIVVGAPTISYFYFDALPTTVQDITSSSDGGSSVEPLDPLPDQGEIIPFEGDEDQLLNEVGQTLQDIEEGVTERGPSSEKTAKKALFTKFWCSLFSCSF